MFLKLTREVLGIFKPKLLRGLCIGKRIRKSFHSGLRIFLYLCTHENNKGIDFEFNYSYKCDGSGRDGCA